MNHTNNQLKFPSAKLSYSPATTIPGEAKPGELVYDKNDGTFRVYRQKTGGELKAEKTAFRKENVYIRRKECPNGRTYVIDVKIGVDKPMEVRFREIGASDKLQLHNFLLEEIGVYKGSLVQKVSSNSRFKQTSNIVVKSEPPIVCPSKRTKLSDENLAVKTELPIACQLKRTKLSDENFAVKTELPTFTSYPVKRTKLLGKYDTQISDLVVKSEPSTSYPSKRARLSNECEPTKLSWTDLNRDFKSPTPKFEKPEHKPELPVGFQREDFWRKWLDELPGLKEVGQTGCVWIKGWTEVLTLDGLMTLKDHEWLNADCIDSYLKYLSGVHDHVRAIPTYAILSYKGKDALPNKHWYWDLKDAKIVFAPAHLKNSHWAMAIITLDGPRCRLELMDSLNHGQTSEPKQKFMEQIKEMITKLAEKQNVEIDKENFVCAENFAVPQQENGTDCGVFALLYAQYAAESREFDFNQDQMPYFRRMICYNLIRKSLNL